MHEVDLLAVLVHELSSPLGTALLEMDRLRASLLRILRAHRVIGIVHAELSGYRDQLPPFHRRTILKAITALKIGAACIVPQLSRRIAVMAASGAFDAVLHNLVSNAHRHAPGATVMVRAYELAQGEQPWPAESSVTLRGPAVVLEVSDSGPGVAANLRPTLFSFGATSKPGLGGSGIGLWLSRLIVRAHGGELWLADSPSGAVFVSVWPMAPPRQRQHSNASRPVSSAWPQDPQEFGKSVRTAREAAQLTREAFVVQAGISPDTLRNMETGRHRCTPATRYKVIAQLVRFGISPPPKS